MQHSKQLLALLTLTAAAIIPARAQTTAIVDPSIQFQTFQGWGTSLAWWAYVVGGYPEPARSDYMKKAFDPVKGLGLNIVRYNIGGGENPQYLAPNKQFMEPRCAIPGYQPAPGKWDWTADAGQRWVLQDSIKRGANLLEAFSNSPPYWMTISGSVTGNQDGKDNLKPEFNTPFADYLAEVVKHFRDDWGIRFHTLEPLNEPSGSWWKFGNHQEGCHVEREHQNVIVKETGAALSRRGLDVNPPGKTGLVTRVAASDESIIDDAARTFPFYDAASLATMTRVNTHSYGGSARTQVSTFALSAGKDLWLSEYGDGDASGLPLSRRIIEDINGLHPAAWVYWQVVDNAGGSGFLRNPLVPGGDTKYVINKKFYVMAQYSRFIRPGFRFVAVNDPNSLAAYDAKNRTLVIVSTNSGDNPATTSYDLSAFGSLGPSAAVVRTSPTEDAAPSPAMALNNKRLAVTAPGKSVTTYIIHNVAYAGKLDFDPNAFYTITNKSSGLRLEQSGDTLDDFVPVTQNKATNKKGQGWRILGLGGGVYKLVNRNDGLALEVGGNSIEKGAPLDLYHDKSEAPGTSNQQWRLVVAGGGNWKILNAHSGLALGNPAGSAAGAPMQQWPFGDGAAQANQQWRIERVGK